MSWSMSVIIGNYYIGMSSISIWKSKRVGELVAMLAVKRSVGVALGDKSQTVNKSGKWGDYYCFETEDRSHLNSKNSPVKGWSGLSKNDQTHFQPFEIAAEMKTKVQNLA